MLRRTTGPEMVREVDAGNYESMAVEAKVWSRRKCVNSQWPSTHGRPACCASFASPNGSPSVANRGCCDNRGEMAPGGRARFLRILAPDRCFLWPAVWPRGKWPSRRQSHPVQAFPTQSDQNWRTSRMREVLEELGKSNCSASESSSCIILWAPAASPFPPVQRARSSRQLNVSEWPTPNTETHLGRSSANRSRAARMPPAFPVHSA